MIDKQKIEQCIREILIALGEDPDRDGIKDTPRRVAKMYEEVFQGIQYTNDEIADQFGTCFEEDMDFLSKDGIILVKDIECTSYCEHHMALIYDMHITVAYKPKDKVIGLSKIARIADMVCRRLQIQERITSDIFYIIEKVTDSDDIYVKVDGKHGCMTARGIKKHQAVTFTEQKSGIFQQQPPTF
ncbi:GTP cyclohydrolase I [Fictibacillus macauensis ZFHKF-1]|uniref:GTP cyclohydrolase I n=1 Tax=Fictibacillus macauensis ZFHKF-1 TaxID=1196324 RepID=I8AIJ5_9BACL|nr:GTP cyclohydrolase I [Fictibacillus macauensis]EIT85299.1 GTP cyclohydrolase I [Fictibacillus macauensis ZFHKF-1]